MPQANIICGRLVFVSGNRSSRHQEMYVLQWNESKDGTKYSLHVWSHPSKNPPEVKKGLIDKCETMEGMGRLQISDLFTELPVPPQAAVVVGTF